MGNRQSTTAASRLALAFAFAFGCAGAARAATPGSPLGAAFTVSAAGEEAETPTVARSSSGAFVVAWMDRVALPGSYVLKARRYDAAGNALGTEFQVNQISVPPGNDVPAVAMAPNGEFVVAWPDLGVGSTAAAGIYARRFGADGSPLGNEFMVSAAQTAAQVKLATLLGHLGTIYPPTPIDDVSVSINSAGNFVVAWDEFSAAAAVLCLGEVAIPNCISTNPTQILARRYSGGGTTAQAIQQVDYRLEATAAANLTDQIDGAPSVALAEDGSYAVAWSRSNQLDAGPYFRRYDSAGNATTLLAQQVSDNSAWAIETGRVALAVDGAGNFTMVYLKGTRNGESFGEPIMLYARTYGSKGTASGAEFRVDDGMSPNQGDVTMAMGPAGAFIVVWDLLDEASANGSREIYAQRFDSSGNKLGANFMLDATPATNDADQMPGVASDASGNFVSVWESGVYIPGVSLSYSVTARLFAGP